jgi:altered-inheritance-of-mitochondria protein 5
LTISTKLGLTFTMAGFLLGAGSGVLAGAAVYYTLSTTIAQNTALVRSE